MTPEVIITICILVILGLISLYIFKSITSKKDKEKGLKFLESIKDSINKYMVDIVAKYDYKKYDNVADLEMDIINTVFSEGKAEITNKISNAINDNIITSNIAKTLDENIKEKFVQDIINKLEIEESIQASFSDKFQQACENNEKAEEELNKEFNTEDFFADEEVDESMLEPATETVIPEEELQYLNPPREEGEEAYNPDDESMEILEIIEEEEPTKEEQDINEIKENVYVDINGRLRDKTTHKFVKKEE